MRDLPSPLGGFRSPLGQNTFNPYVLDGVQAVLILDFSRGVFAVEV